jgi:SAM-dependent methyltransferase
MDEQSRIIAIDPVGPLLDVARKKAGDLAGKRIFFRSEPPTAKLAFADEVYDLVISNLGLLRLDDPELALSEFARVTKVGGRVAVTVPLAGTYSEFFDIYREVLIKNDQREVLDRLEAHIAEIPDADTVVGWLEDAGLKEPQVEVEEFSLLFKSSREFFFAPVIEFGPLSGWKEIAGKGPLMQEIFWNIKEAIDAYFSDRAFEITVKAACFRGTRPATLTRGKRTGRETSAEEVTAPRRRPDEVTPEDDAQQEVIAPHGDFLPEDED